jgi:hypothetical protein
MRPVPPTPVLLAVLLLVNGCHLGPKKQERARGELPESTLPRVAPETDGGASAPAPVRKGKVDLFPDWVIDASVGGVVGAVGVAPRGERSVREQLEEARLSGRLELASMFEVRLQRVGRHEIEEISPIAGPTPDERPRRNLVTVDRNLVDVVIAGSRQRALWFDPESEECYVWMVLDAKILDSAKPDVVEGVSVLEARDPATIPQAVRPVFLDRPPAPPLKAPEPPADKFEERIRPERTIRL